MKRAVTIQIAGQRLSLRSDADEEAVRDIASHVEGRIRDIQKQARSADSHAVALLAALQIAEELFALRGALEAERKTAAEARKALTELKRRVREKTESLLQSLGRRAKV